ncbi:MAG: hypothetical protein JW982_06040 [Spirochaetes bacterium]|nr:hypothetical protein [Spirochaetota bacterium]
MNDNFTISLFGIPVFSAGENPVAVIAVGAMPRGVIAIGWMSIGVFAVGQLSAGIFTIGQLSTGIFTLAQVGISLFFLGQVGIGIIFCAGQGALGFISNGVGYYNVGIGFGVPFRSYPKIIAAAVADNPRPLIIWSVFWITFLTAAASAYFFYFQYAFSRMSEM